MSKKGSDLVVLQKRTISGDSINVSTSSMLGRDSRESKT
jgi:hypothetical protein